MKNKKRQQELRKAKRRQQKINQSKKQQQELEQPKDTQQELEPSENLQQEPEQPKDLQQELKDKIKEIREFIGDDKYIFRGENNEDNEKISSKLYRHFQVISGQAKLQEKITALNLNSIKAELEGKLGKKPVQEIDFLAMEKILKENILTQLALKENPFFSVERIQEELILTDVQEYVDFEDKKYILTELQHYGGATNLIDFSRDLAVALFFACDGKPEKNGRLILFSIDAKTEGVMSPRKNQNNRTIFQNSVFVWRDNGYINERKDRVEKIIIPKELKPLILIYVQNYFDIRTETVYGDLTGYIQNQERHSEAYKQFFVGLIHYDDKKLEKAIECYSEAIELKPNFAAAYSNRGDAKMEIIPRDFEGIFDDYNDAIARNPNYAGAYNNRSAAYNERGEEGDYDFAIIDSNKAIELNPNFAAAYNNRGGSYGNKGENDRAIIDFSKAIDLKYNYALAYKNRAYAYIHRGEFDRAIDDFSKLIEINQKDATVYNDRGMAHFHKGMDRFQEGMDRFHKGMDRFQEGDFDRAIADFSKAIKLNLDYAEAYNNRGEVYGSKRNYDFALIDFNKAIALNPKYARAYYNFGITPKTLHDDKETRKYFEIALLLAKQQKKESLVTLIQEEMAKLPAAP